MLAFAERESSWDFAFNRPELGNPHEISAISACSALKRYDFCRAQGLRSRGARASLNC